MELNNKSRPKQKNVRIKKEILMRVDVLFMEVEN